MDTFQIQHLAPTCPTAVRYVGEILVLTSNTTMGTSPYTYTFWALPPGATTYITLGAINQLSNTVTYKLTSADVTTVSGIKLRLGVDVTDSCPTGALTASESCTIDVKVSTCTSAPSVTLSIM